MKILVTGGAGFLGLHLVSRLVKDGHQVVFNDIQDFDKNAYPKTAKFVKADVRDVKKMEQLIRGVDAVVHAAAALPLWSAEDIISTNVNGTKNILEAAVKNKVAHVIYISSTAVYGVPKKHPVYESDPMVGVGPYGKSKIEAEALCNQYRKKGLVVTIIRPKTFLGTHRLGVFEILFDWIHEGKKIPVIGDGTNRYQLLEVDDLVEAIKRLLTVADKRKINDAFNIGAEKFRTVREDLQELFKHARLHSPSRSDGGQAKSGSSIFPTPAGPIKAALYLFEKLKLSPLYQWVYSTADKDSFVSIAKLTKTLNWHPRYSNAESLIKAYDWYRKNYPRIKSAPAGITHTVGWNQGILRIFKRFL